MPTSRPKISTTMNAVSCDCCEARTRITAPGTLYLTQAAHAAPVCRQPARTESALSEPTQTNEPATIDDVEAGLREAGYLPGPSTALVSFLATKLGKPVLVEGPAGVGKTELAKALSGIWAHAGAPAVL